MMVYVMCVIPFLLKNEGAFEMRKDPGGGGGWAIDPGVGGHHKDPGGGGHNYG